MTSAIWQSGARVHRSSALWLPCSILVFLTAVSAFFRWHMPGAPQDDGILLVAPERFLRGDLPNRDFLSVYGPGNIWLLAAFYKVFGVSLMTARCVGALYQSAIVCGVFLVARRVGRFSGLVCALITLLLLIPLGSAPYAWIGGLGLATWSLVFTFYGVELSATSAKQRLRFFCAGLCAALAVTWRPDLVVALTLFFAFLWRSLSSGQKKRLLGGIGFGLLPLSAHLLVVSPQLFIDNCLIEPMLRFGPGRRLAFSSLGFERQLCILVTSLSAIGILVCGVLSQRNDASVRAQTPRAQTPRASAAEAALGCFCIGLLTQAWQRSDATHVRCVACIVLALLPYAIASWWQSHINKRLVEDTAPAPASSCEDRLFGLPISDSLRLRIGRWGRERRPRWMAPAVLFILILLAPQLFADEYFQKRNTLPGAANLSAAYEVRNNRRVFLLDSATNASDTQATIDFVQSHVASGRRLFVGERDLSRAKYNDTFWYYLFPDLQPASYYMELFPHSAKRSGSSLAPDIATADVLVLTTAYAKYMEPNASLIPGSTVADQTVHALFRQIYARGSYTVWVKKRGVNGI